MLILHPRDKKDSLSEMNISIINLPIYIYINIMGKKTRFTLLILSFGQGKPVVQAWSNEWHPLLKRLNESYHHT